MVCSLLMRLINAVFKICINQTAEILTILIISFLFEKKSSKMLKLFFYVNDIYIFSHGTLPWNV